MVNDQIIEQRRRSSKFQNTKFLKRGYVIKLNIMCLRQFARENVSSPPTLLSDVVLVAFSSPYPLFNPLVRFLLSFSPTPRASLGDTLLEPILIMLMKEIYYECARPV